MSFKTTRVIKKCLQTDNAIIKGRINKNKGKINKNNAVQLEFYFLRNYHD